MLVTDIKSLTLTKYTAPKLPWPISLRSVKSFSGSSLKKSSAISGSLRLPARLVDGILLGNQLSDSNFILLSQSLVHLYEGSHVGINYCRETRKETSQEKQKLLRIINVRSFFNSTYKIISGLELHWEASVVYSNS